MKFTHRHSDHRATDSEAAGIRVMVSRKPSAGGDESGCGVATGVSLSAYPAGTAS